jgi:predicted transposase/invertase (TIGR01784 family)
MTVASKIEQKGRQEGIEKNKIDIAKNMLADNFDINVIGKITGLSVEQISALKKAPMFKLTVNH